MGRWEGGRVCGMLKVGNTIHNETDSSNVFSVYRAQKQPQSTWLAETVVGSSFTHHVALLVPLSGSTGLVVNYRGFIGSAKDYL